MTSKRAAGTLRAIGSTAAGGRSGSRVPARNKQGRRSAAISASISSPASMRVVAA
jgi:hypothetical protein